MRFTVPAGTRDYFSFGQLENGVHAYYILSGDLNQMGTMERVLREAGFNVIRSQSGTYPGFPQDAEEEYKRALKYLFDNRIAGWWNQHDLTKYGLVTKEEFDEALQRET